MYKRQETDNDILSVEAVKMHLDNRDVFMEVEKEINSTNQYLKKRGIEENLPHGSFVAAEAQTEGKGRRGRSFYSPAGSGLYLSVLPVSYTHLDVYKRQCFHRSDRVNFPSSPDCYCTR